jgi:hypothetical protein
VSSPAKFDLSKLLRSFGLILLLAMMLGFSVAVSGRMTSADQSEEMRKLDFLLGEWKGQGWEFRPDGSRSNEFSQKTKVQYKGDGSALRIKEARNYKTLISAGQPVYHSSTLDATIYYDEGANLYRWRGENSDGRKHPLEAKLIDTRTLQYGMPLTVTLSPYDGARLITIEVTKSGEWHETLEIWMTDKWLKAEESTLRRVK